MRAHPDVLQGKVLIVDDNRGNILLLERLLRGAGYASIASTTDPMSVCALHVENRYDLILLDLQMPGMDGFEVMRRLKEIESESYPPVLVITAQPEQKLRALQAGARDFISKPVHVAEVVARVGNMLETRLLHKELRGFNDLLEQRVAERTASLQETYLETIYLLVRATEHRDDGTGAHVHRISQYCQWLSAALGHEAQFVDLMYFASPMHDIGKIGIPDHILLKTGALTPEEWVIMKGHTVLGSTILGNNHSPYLTMGAEIARNHHERWDGGGYPAGKRGEAIPLSARIMNLCDVYDALRSRRPYKPPFDHAQAVDIILRGDGRTRPEHFDPAILDVFAQHHTYFGDIFQANVSCPRADRSPEGGRPPARRPQRRAP